MTESVPHKLRPTLIATGVVAAFALGLNYSTLSWLVGIWNSNPDYSHGFFVPLISLFLLYHRSPMLSRMDFTQSSKSAPVVGVALLVLAISMKATGIYLPAPTVEAFALLPLLMGIVVMCSGYQLLIWATPAILFLVFMIPLPGFLSGALSSQLQRFATVCATYVLQTLGIPAVSNGNIISLTSEVVGVAEACSGIRMLYSFFALSVGLCLVIDRPLWERIVLCFSAIGIAVAANLVRIVATAMAYEFGNAEFAEKIFHDFAGYLMMPLAMVLLWVEIMFLERVFISEKRGLA